jgi:hypothetical protein
MRKFVWKESYMAHCLSASRALAAFSAVLILLTAPAAFAEEAASKPNGSIDLKVPVKSHRAEVLVNEFELGYEYMYFHYKEPGLMKETGSMNGLFGRYTHHFPRGMMVRVEVEALFGNLRYDGQYSDGTPLTTDNDDWLAGGRLLAGKDFLLDREERWALTPYIGIAARYWYDDIKASGGYEREITQLYSPIGLELNNALSENWRWGARAEYDLFWAGWVKSHMGQVSGYEDFTNTQDAFSGQGAEAAVFLKYRLETVSLLLEPYYRYWWVGESNSETINTPAGRQDFVEPENNTHMAGVRLGVAF